MRRPRSATTRASRLFIVPEATLRGLAYGSSSRSSRSRLIASKRARGRKTSPLLFVVGVVEAEHRHPVRPRRKRRRRLFADALGGAVGGDEVGELRLQVPQLALEAVVLRVGDLRPVEHVVEVLVPAQLAPQL